MFDIILIFAPRSYSRFCILMSKKCLIISTSTELIRIAPENVVYFEADGNYCYMQADNNSRPSTTETNNECDKRLISSQLGTIAVLIKKQLGREGLRFIQIGRSLIVNRDYIYYIHTQKQQLFLTDSRRLTYHLKASKEALKQLKEKIEGEDLKNQYLLYTDSDESEKEIHE